MLSGQGDRLGEVKTLAAALRPNVHFDGPLRWMTSLAASFLFSQSLALQAANAEDVVNYSDFIDSVIWHVWTVWTIIGFVMICIIQVFQVRLRSQSWEGGQSTERNEMKRTELL